MTYLAHDVPIVVQCLFNGKFTGARIEAIVIAVIFEVWPADGRKDDYLGMAAALRADLETMDGFISVERFQSLTDPAKLLSISFWRDEESLAAWRNNRNHRNSQAAGRGGIFADYRLRIGHVMRDYGMRERTQVPDDSRALHDRQPAI